MLSTLDLPPSMMHYNTMHALYLSMQHILLYNIIVVYNLTLQWNPSVMSTIETKDFGRYRGVASNQGFISTISMEWGPQ